MTQRIIDDPNVNKVIKKPDGNPKIWRYLDFPKFVSLLHENLFLGQSIYLPDKFEGFWPETYPELDEYLKKLREYTCINCWQSNESDSALLWEVYPKSNNGIAIQSTFNKLCQSVENEIIENEIIDLYVGEVNYLDNFLKLIPGLTFEPFFNKRKYFKEENEIRIIYQEMGVGKEKKSKIDFDKHGIYIKVDLDKLIENIYTSPNAEKWFPDLVQSIVNKYKLNRKVKKSPIGDFPAILAYEGTSERKSGVVKTVQYNCDTSGNMNTITDEFGQPTCTVTLNKED